jgi:hypothetical protein
LVKLPLPDNREVAREPDIVVILNGNTGRFAEQYFEGAPVFAYSPEELRAEVER